jgi:RimJ/RimL family protein N-acetyltransferase
VTVEVLAEPPLVTFRQACVSCALLFPDPAPRARLEKLRPTDEQWKRNGFGPWAAIEKATGRWVGRIGLDELPDWPGPHKVEVGWELHQEFWGRGLATEGGRAGVGYGLETVGLERIISVTMATNAASRRVMEKCGLRLPGRAADGGNPGGLVCHRPVGRAGRRPKATGPHRQADPPEDLAGARVYVGPPQ